MDSGPLQHCFKIICCSEIQLPLSTYQEESIDDNSEVYDESRSSADVTKQPESYFF